MFNCLHEASNKHVGSHTKQTRGRQFTINIICSHIINNEFRDELINSNSKPLNQKTYVIRSTRPTTTICSLDHRTIIVKIIATCNSQTTRTCYTVKRQQPARFRRSNAERRHCVLRRWNQSANRLRLIRRLKHYIASTDGLNQVRRVIGSSCSPAKPQCIDRKCPGI